MDNPNEGQLRVWHIPQIPGEPFHVMVDSIEDAVKVLKILWDYDDFEYQQNIKYDYESASGLEVYETDEWCEWYSDDGDDIMEHLIV